MSGQGVEINQFIGKSYSYIHRDFNPKEFRETFKLVFEKDHVADLDPASDTDTKMCYAFVCHGEIQPLYKNQSNYIMSESGATFANLSYK